MGLIEETCNVEFDENNGSQVEQSGTCDVGDEIPPQAIRRMGVGFILPIEEPLVAEGEGQCSTPMEPSSVEDPQEHGHGQASSPQASDLPPDFPEQESTVPPGRSLWGATESPALTDRSIRSGCLRSIWTACDTRLCMTSDTCRILAGDSGLLLQTGVSG